MNVTCAWDKEKIWVTDRNWTHDLLNSWQALQELMEGKKTVNKNVDWGKLITMGSIGNTLLPLLAELLRLKFCIDTPNWLKHLIFLSLLVLRIWSWIKILHSWWLSSISSSVFISHCIYLILHLWRNYTLTTECEINSVCLRTVMLVYKLANQEWDMHTFKAWTPHCSPCLSHFNKGLANRCLPDKILSFIFRTMKVILKSEQTQQYT